ncbi:hypothetical protein [Parahaliea aestuarii]|uniref:DUF4124 domain-containing protein n=1 Tax=Parahaliea aestuarii TaxID=1852021 RepID=A0A5C8ZYU8_9GAMM|nr:hypothetical protein [Parahaliea aestuarii]TXS92421.1 hypothetical protein FVW59_08345 [Parahaliea aestuarii]
MKTIPRTLLLFAALALPVSAGERLYRYTNAEGNVVIDDKVPSEFVSKGYEVLSSKGKVLEVIPPRRTDEEAREVAEAEAAAREAKEYDRNLLLRYSSVEDIEAARDRALDELKIRIRILESNRITLNQSLASYQSEAADAERRGVEADDKLLEEIDNLQEELAGNEQRIGQRRVELDAVAASYERDIARFEEILDLVKLRQQRERGEL